GALTTLGLAILSITIRTVQEVVSVRRVRALEERLRPRATVVRDGREREMDADQILPGDLVLVRPGDQLQADGTVSGTGRLVVDASAVTGVRGWERLVEGDEVLAGSVCVSGRGAYVARRVGRDRNVLASLPGRTTDEDRRTPLERVVARVLTGLLVVVTIYVLILLAKYARLEVGDAGDALVDAAPVIFSLLPTGLYLMIISTYATNTSALARMGALVRSAHSVESLAESTVICFTDVGSLSGLAVELHPLPAAAAGDDAPSAARLRQMIGDLARNVSRPTPISKALTLSFDGELRPVRWSASRLAERGWAAVAFDDDDADLYVLGLPQVLARHVVESRREEVAAFASSTDAPGEALVPAEFTLAAAGIETDVLVLAHLPGGAASAYRDLPDGLLPLATVSARRRLRQEAIAVVRDFVEAGVRIKVFAAGDPAETLRVLREAGLSSDDEGQLLPEGGLSRADLEALPPHEWHQALRDFRLFGGLLPEQVAELIRLLRADGHHVTVVGDGLTDLPALREASIAVAQPSSAQAALGRADIVLLDSSSSALLGVLRQGQKMVRGLLDVMKLNLVLVLCSAILILAVRLVGVGFPYQAGHGSAVSVLAITVPSLLLPLWASHGSVSSADYRRILGRFVIPAGLTLSLAAFAVYLIMLARTDSVRTTQNAVAYTLLFAGLSLSVFIQPPRIVRTPDGGTRLEARTLTMAVV
nr:HAD family hydrolase [Actinomycetales bacterium]